mgnify:CR=1 FL=1
MKTTFGEMVRHHRSRSGLTLRAAAGLAGLSPGYWSRIENDKASPGISAAISIAIALGIDPDTTIVAAGFEPVESLRVSAAISRLMESS